MLRGEGNENGEKTTIGLKRKSNFACTPVVRRLIYSRTIANLLQC